MREREYSQTQTRYDIKRVGCDPFKLFPTRLKLLVSTHWAYYATVQCPSMSESFEDLFSRRSEKT